MHVEEARLFEEEMVVERGDFDAVFKQGGHDRIDFVLRQDEIAHEDFAATPAFGHCHPAAEAERRRGGLPGDGHLEIIARDIYLQHFGFEIAGTAEERENFLIVFGDVLGPNGSRTQQQCKQGRSKNSADEFH